MWRHRGALRATLTLFTIGLISGGMLTASAIWAVAGFVDWVPTSLGTAAVFATGALVLAQESRLIHIKLPANHRQVPQEVFTNGPYRAAMQFGFELGTGVRTYLPSSVPYLLVTALLLLRPPLAVALLAGASFGLGRAAMAIVRTMSPDPEEWDIRLHARLKYVRPGAALTSVAAIAVLIA